MGLYDPEFVLGTVARHRKVRKAIRDETRELEYRAKVNLAAARASTPHRKIKGPDRLTRIQGYQDVPGEYGDIDGMVCLEAPNAIAIEFGHGPSGVFGDKPSSKSPWGLYILTRAAYRGGSHVVASYGRKKSTGSSKKRRRKKR